MPYTIRGAFSSSYPTAEAVCEALNLLGREGIFDVIILDPSGAEISQIELLKLALAEKDQAKDGLPGQARQ